MEYLGQDCASITINKVKIFMDHPGGGSAQSISYKPQKRIEIFEESEDVLKKLDKDNMSIVNFYFNKITKKDCVELYKVAKTPDEALDYIENYDPTDIDLSKVKIR